MDHRDDDDDENEQGPNLPFFVPSEEVRSLLYQLTWC